MVDIDILAEWGNIKLEMIPESDFGSSMLSNRTVPVIKNTLEVWKPHKDSNQLDMLEDKMIEQNNYHHIIQETHIQDISKEKKYIIWYQFSGADEKPQVAGVGKTRNEARLNAILNYIEIR